MNTALLVAATGLATTLGLIAAIGPQNLFVLRQGLTATHVLPVIALCTVSDAILILAGTAGLGAVVTSHPGVVDGLRYLGGAYLLVLGALAARRCVRPVAAAAAPDLGAATSAGLWAVLGTAAAMTWLNPHTYLDTVVLIGSLANSHGSTLRWVFALGACAGSVLWFVALGKGASRMSPLFRSPRAWRVLDAVVAVVMGGMGIALIAAS
ncbi:LysE/ArgO family amino acid transporter [Gordonia sp. PP30]|uniref:LysE/ArgO family amino acid transporter n=1 Tax=unclassified Gordonia (in: high G+C Gram-positive bacteria) TaxID=2657482 RepID=UPI0020003373|nr:LysE/ArgO family amino acid transporter [Gordonia sp. PP30]UQE75417.1 LysE/ArgO family amino acid transporter [Gordonia sp. PP30]